MSLFLWRNTCPHCGHIHDSTYSRCPKCNSDQGGDGRNFFDNMLHVNIFKQIGFLLMALIGLSFVAAIVQSFQLSPFKAANPDATSKQIEDFLNEAPNLFTSNTIAYAALLIGICILLWNDWKELLSSFKSWKTYAFGAIGFAAVIVFSMFYSTIVSNIYGAIGREMPPANSNQERINDMIMFQPIACFFVFGLIGPFTEEVAYRVGLFGAATRFSKVFGYIVAVIGFAAIHFSSKVFANPSKLEAELIALPSYIFSGLAFSFLYQKFGFGASFFAHATNNMLSVVVNYVKLTMPQ